MAFAFNAAAQEMKVCSFNIRYDNPKDGKNKWDNRKSNIKNFIAYEEPIIIGLQEALLHQIEYLHRAFVKYQWIGVGRDDGYKKGEFSPILYDTTLLHLRDQGTFWLSNTPDQPSKSWDAALPRVCTWAKFEWKKSFQAFYVFNTHYDHVGKEARENASEIIRGAIALETDYQKVILMGDFNAQRDDKPIENLLFDGRLIDSYEAAKLKYGPQGTFNGFDTQRIPQRRIDYIFTSRDVEILKYKVESILIDGKYLSDHFPIIVKLEIP